MMAGDFNKKRNIEVIKKRFLFQGLGILFIFGTIFLIVADIEIYQKRQRLQQQIDAYKKQIEYIKNSNQNLKEEIANSDSKDYLEKVAYEQFSQARPGEIEYIFVKQSEVAKTSLDGSKNISLWGKICLVYTNFIDWIKNKF